MIQQPNLRPNIVYKQNAYQSLSQLTLTALFTKESLAIRLVKNSDFQPNIAYKQNIFNLSVSYADSSLCQREPCCSFGLKCRFVTEHRI